MPWDLAGAARHNKGLTRSQQAQWASTANAVLKRTGDEARAIRIANSKFEAPAKRKLLRKRQRRS